MLPQSRGVFNTEAYWLGHPDTGYGDNWSEWMSIGPIEILAGGDDFTYLTFDYFAEGDYITDNENFYSVRDGANLEINWTKNGEEFTGNVWGSWTDLNENGIRPFHACEDFDLDNSYEEVEYFGDLSDKFDSALL